MTLRAKLLVCTDTVVLTLFGISEWHSCRQTSLLLEQHEALLGRGTDPAAALAHLQAAKIRPLASAAAARFLGAGLTVVVLTVVLGFGWHRLIALPLRDVLNHMNLMGRGTWTKPVPVRRSDEIGELTAALNQLGQELTRAVQQFTNASTLAAVALIAQREGRRIALAREHILSVITLLGVAREYRQEVPEAALRNLELVAKDLTEMQAGLQAGFQQELRDRFQGEPEQPAECEAEGASAAR